jgi:hypothetical protein
VNGPYVGVADHVPHHLDVPLEGMHRGVDHHRGIAVVDRGAAGFDAPAVVEVVEDGNGCLCRGCRGKGPAELDADIRHHLLVGGDEHGGPELLRGLHDGQKIPDVGIVERGHREPFRVGPKEHCVHHLPAIPFLLAHLLSFSMKRKASS